MATAITTYPAHTTTTEPQQSNAPAFIQDLFEDIRTTVPQMQGRIHSDLFHKYLLTLASCYFALIVLLLCGMVPFLYLVNYKW